jgi:Fe-S cluster assembly scaffold protein SufB
MTTMTKKNLSDILSDNNLSAPSKKDENWLVYPLDALLDNSLEVNPSKKSSISITEKYYLHFFNGTLHNHHLPSTVSLSDTTIGTNKEDNSFYKLAIAESIQQQLTFTGTGETIELYYETTENTLSNQALAIQCEKNSNNTIKRTFYAPNQSVLNAATTITLSDNSHLLISDTNNNNQGYILDTITTTIGASANLNCLNQTYLCNNSRFEHNVTVTGEESVARLHGLAINEVDQQCCYNTHVYHDTENSESHQLFKSLVKNNATLEYNGKVTVMPKAQQTNSYQLNQNIILDDFANVYSRPQLFIDADDVKCSHGSTTGDINKHEVLYLMSRGIDELTSRKIVLNGYIQIVFETPEFKPERQSIQDILNQIL